MTKEAKDTLALVTDYSDRARLIRQAEALIASARRAAYAGIDPARIVEARETVEETLEGLREEGR